jgi:hypothetical protein
LVKRYNPRWQVQRELPVGLEFNSTVAKQSRQKSVHHIDQMIGSISVADMTEREYSTFKTATVGILKISKNDAGNVS